MKRAIQITIPFNGAVETLADALEQGAVVQERVREVLSQMMAWNGGGPVDLEGFSATIVALPERPKVQKRKARP